MKDDDYKPWEDPHSIWKTEAAFNSYLRSGIRKALWSRYPVKINWKNEACRPVSDLERKSGKFHPSTKFVGACTYCNEAFPKSKLEVDHISQASQVKLSFETVGEFIQNTLCASDNFCLTCKPCHKIKSHQEKNPNMTFEEARIDKDVIDKMKMKVDAQKKQLLRYGFSEDEITNKEKRRACFSKHLTMLAEEKKKRLGK